MLTARSSRTFHTSKLATTIFLERRFRAHLVSRDRLIFDSRYSPPARKATPYVHVYASMRGGFQIGSRPNRTDPQLYILAETELDRILPSSTTFRSGGAPAVILEVRISADDVLRPSGFAAGTIEIGASFWDACAKLETQRDAASLEAVLAALAEHRVIAPDIPRSIVREEPERFVRLWDVLRPLYEDLATGSSLKQIAQLAKLSLRQLGRDLGEVTRTFGLFGGGFRDVSRILRLRAAILLLSAPGSTPGDVAREVGYGSLDAMGRAFRDARLPAPSVIQAAVQYVD